jgi:hypothetical protein
VLARAAGADKGMLGAAVPFDLGVLEGQIAAAQRVIEWLPEITRIVIPRVIFYRNAEHRDLYLEGLRRAAGAAGSADPPACRDL